jgi:hypothetical protein
VLSPEASLRPKFRAEPSGAGTPPGWASGAESANFRGREGVTTPSLSPSAEPVTPSAKACPCRMPKRR